MSDISLIAALDKNRAIGRDGAMPWHLPDDLRRFKQLTLGKPVLMGRKTALAIGRALPGRRNLVLTRSGAAPFADQQAVESLAAAIVAARDEELMAIGGGEVYAQALTFADRMVLTEVEAEPEGDTHFPQWDPAQWQRTSHEVRDGFAFSTYDRV